MNGNLDARHAMLRFLLEEQGVDPNRKDRWKHRPLTLFCSRVDARFHPEEDLRDLRLLLEHGADPNIEGGDGLPLMLVAKPYVVPEEAVRPFLELLLEFGADPNREWSKGRPVWEDMQVLEETREQSTQLLLDALAARGERPISFDERQAERWARYEQWKAEQAAKKAAKKSAAKKTAPKKSVTKKAAD